MQPIGRSCSLLSYTKKLLMKKILFLALFFTISVFSFGQNIIIDPNPTPVDLVTNTLIGPGLVTSNITFSGQSSQIGFFDGNNSGIGLDSGVVMSSGNVIDIQVGNNPSGDLSGGGDPDVLATAQSVTSNPQAGSITSTHDAAILEFDFVPNGDVVVFNFVFASEEYLTYVNTQFNDAFGFYLSGPNPAGGSYNVDNLALVPGTNEPITISTIQPNLNGQYYIDQTSGTFGHSFNGFTVPIEIRFNVICDSTYHFKFAIADCQDGILDTGVFLDGGSFQSIPVDLNLETNVGTGPLGDSVIYEGCGVDAEFVFTRPSCQSSDSLWVDVAISGTATNGVDYATLPDSVLFLPDSTSTSIPFSAFQDGVNEGFESVILTVTNILSSGDTIISVGTLWLYDEPNVSVVAQDTLLYCLHDSVEIFAPGFDGIPPYTWDWSPMTDTTYSTFVPADSNGTFDYYVTITDACGFQDTDTLTVIQNQTLAIDTLMQFPASACLPDGAVSAIVVGDSVNPSFQIQYLWENQSQTDSIAATVWQNISSGWYYFTVTDAVCSVNDSVFVEQNNPPIANLSSNATAGCNPFEVAFTNSSENSASYLWDFGDGTSFNINDLSGQNHTFTSSSQVMLVAYDANSCSDTAYVDISVIACGCTDPNAENYDPNAVQNDGSCTYPVPMAYTPNVFTANNDGQNDIFFIRTENTVQLELVILNRWGNVMYDQTIDVLATPAAGWNGTTPNGNEAGEGTYFYRYIATGVNGDKVEGHGFVQLVRD